MNKRLFLALSFTLAVAINSNAQVIPNYSFENWSLDTNYLDLTLTTPATLDTTISSDPNQWTTSNDITNGNVFNHKVLVSQSSTAFAGSSSMQLRSDSLSGVLTGVPGFGTYALNFVCPGFAVCGRFNINLTAFVNLGGAFNPALLPGAGIPVSKRYASIGGYLKYNPQGGDTAYIIAVLRQGSTVVAQAVYQHYSTDAAFVPFNAPFVYQNCLAPDTMVYTISSGNPYSVSSVVLGSPSGLHAGSTLLADSIYLVDTASGFYAIEPQAMNDSAHTQENASVMIGVLSNDLSCDAYSIDSIFHPLHGTAMMMNDSIMYMPATGFHGIDTFYYNIRSGNSPASNNALVSVRVIPFGLGISTVNEGSTGIYPNPASSRLYISNHNSAVNSYRIVDMLGHVIREDQLSSSSSAVDLTGFSNGLYIIHFGAADGKQVSSSRFTVIR